MSEGKFKTAMRKFFDWKWTIAINMVLAFGGLLFFLSCHSVLGFMGHYTFPALPYILGGLLGVSAAITLAMFLTRKRTRVLMAITFFYNAFMFIIALAYFLGFSSNGKSILYEFGEILVLYAFFAIIFYLAFFHHGVKYRGKKAVATILVVVLIAGAILGFTDFSSLRINYITEGAAVYAVEDDYQIVWRTRAKGVGWVEIAGEKYYDTYNGSMRSTTRVHKVSVPQSTLDEAKAYSIHSRALVSEQSWSGLMGYEIKKSYPFRPVDPSDGIQFYAVSDVHDFPNPAKKAMGYWGEKLDFLVMAGDMTNYLESEWDNARILAMANQFTGGIRPIVFARGNHELKAVGSENLHQYVGAIGEQYYYTFRLQNVWGIVLDMGEDHADDWYEFYGTALFDDYRSEQLDFVDEVIANEENEYLAEGVDYRIGVCHVSTAIAPYEEQYMYDALVELNHRLNRMNLDVMISGHLHQPFIIESGYELGEELYYTEEYWSGKGTDPAFLATSAYYPSVLCSRRSSVQNPKVAEKLYGGKFIGVALEFKPEAKTVRYTNEKGELVQILNPFERFGSDTEFSL